jgi:hypothetical protein
MGMTTPGEDHGEHCLITLMEWHTHGEEWGRVSGC